MSQKKIDDECAALRRIRAFHLPPAPPRRPTRPSPPSATGWAKPSAEATGWAKPSADFQSRQAVAELQIWTWGESGTAATNTIGYGCLYVFCRTDLNYVAMPTWGPPWSTPVYTGMMPLAWINPKPNFTRAGMEAGIYELGLPRILLVSKVSYDVVPLHVDFDVGLVLARHRDR